MTDKPQVLWTGDVGGAQGRIVWDDLNSRLIIGYQKTDSLGGVYWSETSFEQFLPGDPGPSKHEFNRLLTFFRIALLDLSKRKP